MAPRIEDAFSDILAKASTGRGLGNRELAEKAGCSEDAIRALKNGSPDPTAVRKVAQALDLDPGALLESAQGRFSPPDPLDPGIIRVTTAFPVPGYPEMTVNSYLLRQPASRHALLFDAGAEVDPLMEVIHENGLTVDAIYLTHAHRDHVAVLDEVVRRTGNPPVHIHENEALAKSHPFPHGRTFRHGSLGIEARHTPGHSPGGTVYAISGLQNPLAIVGDTVFAGSIGGVRGDYEAALRAIRENILSLDAKTILCPGHGPASTVQHERAHNPFLAAL